MEGVCENVGAIETVDVPEKRGMMMTRGGQGGGICNVRHTRDACTRFVSRAPRSRCRAY